MFPEKAANNQMPLFRDTLDQRASLYILAEKIDWKRFNEVFLSLLYQDNGRPAKPIRRMVGLLILMYLRNRSDVFVVEEWFFQARLMEKCKRRFPQIHSVL